MVTESDVISVLREATKPLKAREIAALLQRTLHADVTRSDVNQILYRLKTRGVAEIDEEFKWQFFEVSNSTESRRKAGAQPESRGDKAESYYDVLQVTRNAHPNVIMKAYKALASVYHPDHSTPVERAKAEERMKLINVAYEVLSDSRKRAEYDKKLGD